MEKTAVTKNQIVNELIRIGHGDLSIYLDTGLKAIKTEPELFAHLIAWNYKNGKVRDSKAAFPVIALRGNKDNELYENAIAHLCMLSPRELLKAVTFNMNLTNGEKIVKEFYVKDGKNKHRFIKMPYPQHIVEGGAGTILKQAVTRYIRAQEANRGRWNKTALLHRESLKRLYALYHVKPARFAQRILFENDRPRNSVFEAVYNLKNMSPTEAAGTILNYKIPFQIAKDKVPNLVKKPEITLALMEQMSGQELINNTNMLKNLGVFSSPVLKTAYDKAAQRAMEDTKVSTLKASKAMKHVSDPKAKAKLKKIQNDQLAKLGGIDGDWLVLGDKSGSMHSAINVARQVSALIAQQVKGTVNLVFFNTTSYPFDATNKDFDEITKMTRRIYADGGTSIGVGLDYIMSKGILVNGIAICSDGGENTAPIFTQTYKKYAAKFGIEPTIYYFRVPGDQDRLSLKCEAERILLEIFDIKNDTDFYSLPNLVKTMRTSRYTLVEEIMDTPLMTLAEVFKDAA